MMGFTLEALDQRVAARATASPEESWTAKLLAAGIERAAKKFGEESAELIIAAVTRDPAGTTAEAADVLYHLLVLLRGAGVPLADVMAELEKRTAQSGIAEKAGRRKS
ncbi:MAG: phosphoribosyl-ATP diphosphatase [Devosia sp.]|uniref:phosphoribosyl-ATP diphosphatase n=1 Tax=Devosia sp. TaxID=1871048 RepID=UPI001AD59513|nr:phosphoribosyl-ATP diphosphatase [Devosia sp.]MBN9315934.1 phosphoribosyl-ATP diphosphatase [Devosia sp.]